MNRATKRFVFFKDLFIYLFIIYVYVSSLLLLSLSTPFTRPCAIYVL